MIIRAKGNAERKFLKEENARLKEEIELLRVEGGLGDLYWRNKAEELLQKISAMSDVQSALHLVRNCVSFCKLSYSIRTVSPSLHADFWSIFLIRRVCCPASVFISLDVVVATASAATS